MKRIFKFAILCATTLAMVACGGGEDNPAGSDDGTQTPEPEVDALKIEVLDITAVSARVSVSPKEKKSKYYFDILRAEYYREYNEQFGFQRFIDNTINSLMKANSLTKEEVLSRILSAGDDSYGFTNLSADTEYYAVAMGVDDSGLISTSIYSLPFKTDVAKQSDNTFQISIGSATYTGTTYSVKPADKSEKYVLIPWNKPIVDQLGDKFIDHCIKSRSDIGDYIVSGDQSGIIDSCFPNREYYLVAFGYEGGLATTALSKAPFTTKSGGDPALCNFTFEVSDIQYDRAYMKVTPSTKYNNFFWSVVDKSYYEELSNTIGEEEAMKSVLAESLAPFATDFGNIYDALEIITSYKDVSTEGTTYGLTQGTEYIPWAVCIDNHGKAAAPFVMGTPFKTKNDIISDCTISVKGSFEMDSDGKAVLISTATPDIKCAYFYNVIFSGDLSDASRQSLMNNIINLGFKNERVVRFDKCPWNQVVTAIAVGVDKDGNFGEIAMDIFTPTKE